MTKAELRKAYRVAAARMSLARRNVNYWEYMLAAAHRECTDLNEQYRAAHIREQATAERRGGVK